MYQMRDLCDSREKDTVCLVKMLYPLGNVDDSSAIPATES